MTGLWDVIARSGSSSTKVAAIGECMIEIVRRPDGSCAFGYAGDTLNTSVYLARLGLAPSYVTALGTDPFSDDMMTFWKAEDIGTELVARRPDKLPGLYIVSTDDAGERRFHYWRNDSAARTLFTLPEDAAQLAALARFALIYWSGISLAILREAARERLLETLVRRRAAGGLVAFDTNFRPRLWPDLGAAREVYAAALRQADIVFTSLDDEAPIFGGDEDALIARHEGCGVRETVIKRSPPGCRVVTRDGGIDVAVEAPPVANVVDTTAAGDSFAAAYLAARLKGEDARSAAMSGHRLAGAVVGVRGAILPRESMPGGL